MGKLNLYEVKYKDGTKITCMSGAEIIGFDIDYVYVKNGNYYKNGAPFYINIQENVHL